MICMGSLCQSILGDICCSYRIGGTDSFDLEMIYVFHTSYACWHARTHTHIPTYIHRHTSKRGTREIDMNLTSMCVNGTAWYN